ncbi:MAG: hypothetical protein BGO51_17080 [Rhodospirillales bacterium 69-11]|nr:UPF0149 family protein [Rhodospirillales bacterium]OJW21287.1 MAG: hypothetical protein BGO51_17080 [Rhodospirillales bacterium 69-11]
MTDEISLPAEMEALDNYLLSDRSPPESMDLSQLDGFLAGVIASPEPILPNEWLPVVWDGEEPTFDSEAEGKLVVGAILGRYNAIASALSDDPEGYMPLFWEAADGSPVVDDWAVGFMRAVSLRAEAWDPVLQDEDSAVLLIPIGIIAGQAIGEEDPNMRLPQEAIDDLMEDADVMLAACTIGLFNFWRNRAADGAARKPH